MRGTEPRTTALAAGILVALLATVALSTAGCRNENDPDYWVGKLEDPVWRDEGLRNLERLYSEVFRENNTDPAAGPVAEYVQSVGASLVKAYSAPYLQEDVTSQNKIVTLLSQMNSPDALPVYIAALEDIAGTKIGRANTAAEAIARFCRADNSEYPPLPAERTPLWQERCSQAEQAAPVLMSAIDVVRSQRQARGTNAENTGDEDALTRAAVSALGNILLGNPQSQHRPTGLDKLVEVLETSDEAQDLSINLLALRLIGRIGDSRSIPVLIRGLFMEGKRRKVPLQEIARVSLQQVGDLNAVADALVKAGSMQDEALNAMQKADSEFDARLIKQQAAITLGMLGIKSQNVLDYLMSELNHAEEDDFDRIPPRGRTAVSTPNLSKAYRRVFAAQALGQLAHEPALKTIMSRMELRNEQLVDKNVDLVEIPGYLDSAGDFFLPSKTNDLFLEWAIHGDEALRDRAARRLSLQSEPGVVPQLEKRAAKMRECDPQLRGCVKRNYIEGYIPTIKASAGCTSAECWAGKLGEESWRIRERAAFEVARLSVGDAAKMGQGQQALLGALDDRSAEVLFALVFALDRISPNGCDAECLSRVDEVIVNLGPRKNLNAPRRAIEGLRARLAWRAKAGG